jgi:hypothetical protein
MVIFEAMEDLLKKISDFNEYSRALVTLASAVGILVIFFYTICLTYKLIKGMFITFALATTVGFM